MSQLFLVPFCIIFWVCPLWFLFAAQGWVIWWWLGFGALAGWFTLLVTCSETVADTELVARRKRAAWWCSWEPVMCDHCFRRPTGRSSRYVFGMIGGAADSMVPDLCAKCEYRILLEKVRARGNTYK